jgi:hypothetical protein
MRHTLRAFRSGRAAAACVAQNDPLCDYVDSGGSPARPLARLRSRLSDGLIEEIVEYGEPR